jgi:Subtilase family
MVGSPRREFSPLLVAPLCAAALGLALLAPGAATAAATGALAPELTKLATPAVAAASAEAQAAALGLPAEGSGSLSREGERVIVEAHFEVGALARLEALKAAGAKILVASGRYQTVALSAEPEDLQAIGAVPGLSIVVPSLRPLVYEEEGPGSEEEGGGEEEGPVEEEPPVPPTPPDPACEGGSVISQGVKQLNVPAAREEFGTSGTGVTVGVLSDSFDSATESVRGGPIATDAEADERSDDLPGPLNTCSGQQAPVNVIAEAPEPAAGEGALTDEGRAMLQVVHDVAPEAELAFATAFTGELGFARNVERLAEPVEDGGAGAKVIVDDVSYPSEPFYQEGPIANAIRRVTEAGVTYLTAAGNNNLLESGTNREIASWERSRFHNTTCPVALESRVREAKADCMNFSPSGTPDSTFGLTVRAGSTLVVDLQWAEPWYGVHADLNAYLLDASGQVIVAHPYKNVGTGSAVLDQPLEYISWKNTSSAKAVVQLVINRCIHNCNSAASVAAEPRLKVALLENGSGVPATQYPESDPEAGIVVGPTIFGHAGSTAAITLGAVQFSEPAAEPKEPERYSSRGPVAHYFGPVSGTTAAAALEPGEAIAKPNLTATDCGATTFFDELFEKGEYRFCGTSEAAPHAAGVAALMKEADPLASPKGIREAMEQSATPFISVTSCEAVGAGLLNADGALAALENPQVAKPCEAALGPEAEAGEEEETSGEEGSTNGGGGGGEGKITPVPTPTPTPTPSVPVVTITKGPKSLGNESRPTFEFTSSKPASFDCQIDSGTPQPCSSPYVVPTALTDGGHGFVVTATDPEGAGASSTVYRFTVDTTAPLPRIVGHPSKLVKVRKNSYLAHFKLAANEAGVAFYCEFDREPMRACGRSFTRRMISGSHVLRVRAKDLAGNLDTVSAIYRFRIKDLRPARPVR